MGRGNSLYVILDTGTGHTKIGRGDDPRSRLKRLQTGNPNELSMLLVIRNGGSWESHLHREFLGARLQGEWFASSVRSEIVATILRMATKVGEAPHYYCQDCGGFLGDVPGAGCRHDVPMAYRHRSAEYLVAPCGAEDCSVGSLAVHSCCHAMAEIHFGSWYCRAHRPR